MIRVEVEGGALWWRLFPLCRAELFCALALMAETAYRLGALAAPDASLDLLLVRDAEIAALNARHMGCTGPTNVLSFPMLEEGGAAFDDADFGPQPCSDSALCGETGEIFLGSLVLSVDAVQREALLYGQEPGEHCLRLLAHGLGHLVGYDHGEDMDELCEAMLDAALQLPELGAQAE